MRKIPEGMISVEEYSNKKGSSSDKIIKMIQDGIYIGRKINDNWYISETGLSDINKKVSSLETANRHSNRLFGTSLEKLYTFCTIIVLIMITFPPTYSFSEGTSIFRGYEFVFDIFFNTTVILIDIGRLILQFIALSCIAITIKRKINKT